MQSESETEHLSNSASLFAYFFFLNADILMSKETNRTETQKKTL